MGDGEYRRLATRNVRLSIMLLLLLQLLLLTRDDQDNESDACLQLFGAAVSLLQQHCSHLIVFCSFVKDVKIWVSLIFVPVSYL